jgi:hypothetical protein
MIRMLVPIGRRRPVAVVVSRAACYGLGVSLLLGAAAIRCDMAHSGRFSAFQAGCREFESRLPLQTRP